MKRILSIITAAVLIISLASCALFAKDGDLWADAIYTENTSFGEGATEFELEVIAKDKSVTFTVRTDKTYLADALTEHKLISGDEGPYGLYVKYVNGIKADYDENQAYWSLTENGNYVSTGVSYVEITAGAHYEFTYAK